MFSFPFLISQMKCKIMRYVFVLLANDTYKNVIEFAKLVQVFCKLEIFLVFA